MAPRTSSRTSWSERLRAQRSLPWWSAWLAKRRVRTGVAAGGAALAVLVLAWTVFARRGPAEPQEPSVNPRPEARRLVEIGDLESAEVTPVYVRTSGEVVWLIDEGALVEAGDVIARIDETELREKLEEEERQLLPRRKELERAEGELEAARARGPLNVRLKEIELDQVRWKLDDLVMRPTEEDLVAAKLDLRAASLRRDKARRELGRVEELGDRGFATETELRSSTLKALNAEADASLAALRLEILKGGASRLSLESARLKVEKAKIEVDEARFLNEADVTIAEKEVEIARARLSKHERQIERRKRDLRNCLLRAPVAGRVAFVKVWKGSRQTSRIEIGETCRWGQMFCKMADPRRMRVRVFVNEVDALRLREGQRARVRLTAFPGVEIAGSVARIGASASDKNEKLGHLALRKAGQAGVSVVEVAIALDSSPALDQAPGADSGESNLNFVRGGYTATVEIDIDEKKRSPPSADTTLRSSSLRSTRGSAEKPVE